MSHAARALMAAGRCRQSLRAGRQHCARHMEPPPASAPTRRGGHAARRDLCAHALEHRRCGQSVAKQIACVLCSCGNLQRAHRCCATAALEQLQALARCAGLHLTKPASDEPILLYHVHVPNSRQASHNGSRNTTCDNKVIVCRSACPFSTLFMRSTGTTISLQLGLAYSSLGQRHMGSSSLLWASRSRWRRSQSWRNLMQGQAATCCGIRGLIWAVVQVQDLPKL